MHCSHCGIEDNIYAWMAYNDHCPHCNSPLVPNQNFAPLTREMLAVGDSFDVCNQFGPEGPWAGLNKEKPMITVEMRVQSISYVDEDTYALHVVQVPKGEKTFLPEFNLFLSKEKAAEWCSGDLMYISLEK